MSVSALGTRMAYKMRTRGSNLNKDKTQLLEVNSFLKINFANNVNKWVVLKLN